MTDDLDDCTEAAELIEALEREAQNDGCENVKRAKRVLVRGEPLGALPPEAIGSAFLTIIETGDDHALRLECAQGLALAADQHPHLLADFLWDIEDLIRKNVDPCLVEHLVTTAAQLATSGQSAAAREVADTLIEVYEGNELEDHSAGGEHKRRAAIEGLQMLAERGNPTVQAHLAQVLIACLKSAFAG